MAEFTPTTEHVRARWGKLPHLEAEFDRWLEGVKREAVLDYVSHRDNPRIQIEFTNQPMFDGVLREAKAEALEELIESQQFSDNWNRALYHDEHRAMLRARVTEYRKTGEQSNDEG